MGFLVLPIMVVLFFIGLGMQMDQLAQAVDGSGRVGRMTNTATVAAQRMQTYAASCLDAATASPGLISPSLTVLLPSGVLAPQGATCMTTAAGAGTRYVYSYAVSLPGEAAQLMTDTHWSSVWYLVQAQGQAVNLFTSTVSAVPAAIPVGTVLDWVQITP